MYGELMSQSGDGLIDQNTARTINSGRETLGVGLRAAQKHLQKVFIVFVIGMIGTIYAMRLYVWPDLQVIIKSRTSEVVGDQIKLIATTPFDVILMQVKVGLVMGVVVSIPLLLYLARDAIREQDWYPEERLSIWKMIPLVVLAAALFLGGLAYGYYLFFPFMFQFLATNAVNTGIKPTYGIVEFTEFVLVLLLSFGLAAELPLTMSGLAYAGIVRYETFRDKWRYAVVGIVTFGALFSPPDPFTQIMWAAPLIVLYAASLYLTKLVVTAKRGRDQGGFRQVASANWPKLLGVSLFAAGAVYAFFVYGGLAYVNAELVPLVDPTLILTPLAPVKSLLGVSTPVAAALVAAGVALAAFVLALLSLVFTSLDAGTEPDMGDPAAIDLADLDAVGVRAAPVQVFAAMDEDEALSHASTAMGADDPEKAQAILDRFDEAESVAAAQVEAAEASAGAIESDETAVEPPADEVNPEEDSGNVVSRTTTGVVNAFSDDEKTEEDIGGYYYDIAFVLESLTSKMFRLVFVFMVVLAGSFFWLQQGGLGDIREDFLRRIPDAVLSPEGAELGLVALHPVEALIFEVKVSTILAAVVTVPLVLYYAWPAIEERGFTTGDRGTFFTWGIGLVVGLVVGTILGYAVVAPTIISYLVYDQLAAGMVISYRLKNFFWLVFLTTAGVGLLADIPITMYFFQRGGIVSYATMRSRWREVTIAVFAVSGLVTPDSLYTMFLIAIPIMIFYGIGLALLWVITLGGRREKPPMPSAPEGTSD